jgi:membrane-bound lytic murein transglycosylase D
MLFLPLQIGPGFQLRNRYLKTAVFCWIIILFLPVQRGPAATQFPRYPVIADNVAFWEKIYTTYSINDAVIHDSEDLSKVYEVLPLLEESLPAANSLNSQAKKNGIAKYEKMLRRLSQGPPHTDKERRIAALFRGANPRAQMRRAAQQVRIQTGLKERFIEGVQRSAQYLEEMKKIFRTYNLPEELAYLPHVESSFNTKAYSRFGAAGIWQFTRETGKQYLTIDYTLDERLDPIAATHAAAKYLQKSYDQLHNWPLALTSYNYGLSGMVRAVEEKGTYERIFSSYNKGYFKFASRNFYSEYLAAVDVASRLEKSNPEYFKKQPLQTFRIPNYIASNALCSHLGLAESTLRELNPALRPPVFDSEKHIPKGYLLRLPGDAAISRRLATIPPHYFAGEQKASQFHRVRKSETASSIARLHQVSLPALMQANNLDKYATIYINQKLRIPGRAKGTPQKAPLVVQIKADDTKLLAEKTHVRNNDTPVPIRASAKKIAVAVSGKETLVPKKDPTVYNVYSTHSSNKRQLGYITVQPEETLPLIASWLVVPAQEIVKLNRWRHETEIRPGQQLLLPFNKVTPDNFEEKRLDHLRETEDDFFTAFAITGQQIYRVVKGDTFWKLCHLKFDIPLWLLERYNSSISLSKLSIGQELIIPIVRSK